MTKMSIARVVHEKEQVAQKGLTMTPKEVAKEDSAAEAKAAMELQDFKGNIQARARARARSLWSAAARLASGTTRCSTSSFAHARSVECSVVGRLDRSVKQCPREG